MSPRSCFCLVVVLSASMIAGCVRGPAKVSLAGDVDDVCRRSLEDCVRNAEAGDALLTCKKKHVACATDAKTAATVARQKRVEAARARWQDYRSHVVLRGASSPGDVVQSAIVGDLHYVGFGLSSLYLRDIPGFVTGDWAALGFELTGILPNGRPIRTVFEPVQLQGDDAEASLKNLFTMMPILYRGQPITATLTVERITEEERPNIQGRIMGAGRALRRLNPTQDREVHLGAMLHTSVLGGLGNPERWRYSFTLYPANSAYRDRPDLLVLEGRAVFIFKLPPGSTRKTRLPNTAGELAPQLAVRDGALIWKATQAPYTETPYLVMDFSRYARWSNEETDLRKTLSRVDDLLEANPEQALAQLAIVPGLIVNDTHITQNEKNLERALLDIRQARAEAALAAKRGDKAAELKQRQRLAKLLTDVAKEFAPMLEPAEVRNMEFLRDRAQRRAQELGIPTP